MPRTGFQPELDFVEDGPLMGVGLSHPGGPRLGLRCDRDRDGIQIRVYTTDPHR